MFCQGMHDPKAAHSLKRITVHILLRSFFLKGLVLVAKLSNFTFPFGNTVSGFLALISQRATSTYFDKNTHEQS